jgi:hypothetical protein
MGFPNYYNLLDTARGNFVLNAQTLAAVLAVGNQWFVNEATGNDTNPGSSAEPFATLDAAIAAAVVNNGDVVWLNGSSHRTSTLNWNKNGVSLISMEAPSDNGRGRISATGATAFSPLVNVTGQGCSFIGIGTFHGGFTGATGSQVCWAEAGGRNYYSNVQFFGGGDATTAALAGMRSLTIGGQGENLLDGCSVGLNTIVRASNPNASLEMIAGTARNTIRRTSFESYCSDVADLHILIAANGMDRWLWLDDCLFHNFGGTALSAAISNAGGSPAGDVIVSPSCISVGATAIATAGAVYVGQISAAGATTTGIGIAAT